MSSLPSPGLQVHLPDLTHRRVLVVVLFFVAVFTAEKRTYFCRSKKLCQRTASCMYPANGCYRANLFNHLCELIDHEERQEG